MTRYPPVVYFSFLMGVHAAGISRLNMIASHLWSRMVFAVAALASRLERTNTTQPST